MTRYIRGDWNLIDDKTGFKIKASQSRLQWNNVRCADKYFEERHTQDFVRGVPDKQNVPFARPESADPWLVTSTTINNPTGFDAGTTTITVASTTGFQNNDFVNVLLDGGGILQTQVTVIDSVTLLLANPLPGRTLNGYAVSDLSREVIVTGNNL